MKIAATVILYYPEKNTIQNIGSYSPFVDTVYVIDNSENPSKEFQQELTNISNAVYFHDNENKGIAKRLNDICEKSRAEGFDWILTMDQDSSFSDEVFEKYLEHFKKYPKEEVAVFAVNYLPKMFPVVHVPVEVLSTITSGSLVNLSLNKVIGKYNEDLFIDLVDAEYCYRAVGLGYKIIAFRDIILNHSIGYIKYGRSLKNFKLTPRVLHSPIRIYYIIRNSLYMLYKFPNLPQQARGEIKKTMSLLKNNILYHKERSKVIKSVIQGYVDFKRNRMGKHVP